ncbi:hypothetical protein HY948_00790 [Candidatus Gottesmanbacteria bacterium]|nr:hypothetical protein [Candidatus Gottesmanbacteria bacterium]
MKIDETIDINQANNDLLGKTPSVHADKTPVARLVVLGVYGLLVLLGVGTGYLLSRGGGKLVGNANQEMINTGTVAGVADEKTFKDSATGTVEKGSMNGEGTHKLVREGGESQTAFLISSVVDLDQYIGKKVKVWGQTFAAEKASWLMDVGKIEIQQ